MAACKTSENILIREFTKELHNHNAAVFIGAGLSMGSGYADWKGLLRDPIMDLGLNPDKETDFVTLAQYYCNKSGGRGALSQVIFDKFREIKKPTKNHELLARLPVQTYWTTNYDKLLERALEDAKKVVDVKYTPKHLAITRLDRDVYVYKMHGDIDHPSEAVLSRDDYESYDTKMAPFVSALRGDLIEKTFLFLGFSFTDPNIDYILSRVRVEYGVDQRNHYCIQRGVSRGSEEPEIDFKHRELRQRYFTDDLRRFGIQTVLVDEYEDITRLLADIESQYKQSSVFISGAAFQHGGFSEPARFLHDLTYQLSGEGNRIISGFGVGVGDSVINGAISRLFTAGKTVSDEDLMLRPFPQMSTDGTPLPELWETYRRLMIENAGVAIFVFGNKEAQFGGCDLSGGMEKEFDLCVELGVKVIPVGATGFMAHSLWERVNQDFESFFPGASSDFRSRFDAIGDANTANEDLIDHLIAMTKDIKRL